MKLEKHMQVVADSYHHRQKKQEKVWKGFEKEKKELENIVSDAFGKVLEEIGPIKHSSIYAEKDDTAEILDYDISYNPQFREFSIKIKKLKTPFGVLDNDDIFTHDICPHGYPVEEHPKIKEFMKDYHVDDIEEPNNDCEHK